MPPTRVWPRCLPGPIPLHKGRLGGPMPMAGQLGCPRSQPGCPALARQLSRPEMDGCAALFCIINNVFGKLRNISAIALNFHLILSRGLEATQGFLGKRRKHLVGAGSVCPLGRARPSLPARAGAGGWEQARAVRATATSRRWAVRRQQAEGFLGIPFVAGKGVGKVSSSPPGSLLCRGLCSSHAPAPMSAPASLLPAGEVSDETCHS